MHQPVAFVRLSSHGQGERAWLWVTRPGELATDHRWLVGQPRRLRGLRAQLRAISQDAEPSPEKVT